MGLFKVFLLTAMALSASFLGGYFAGQADGRYQIVTGLVVCKTPFECEEVGDE